MLHAQYHVPTILHGCHHPQFVCKWNFLRIKLYLMQPALKRFAVHRVFPRLRIQFGYHLATFVYKSYLSTSIRTTGLAH